MIVKIGIEPENGSNGYQTEEEINIVTTYTKSDDEAFNRTAETYIGNLIEATRNASEARANEILQVLDAQCIQENNLTASNLKDNLSLFNCNYSFGDVEFVRENVSLMTFRVNVTFNVNGQRVNRYIFLAVNFGNSTYKIYFGNNNNYINRSTIPANEYNIYRIVQE